jgi:outer membrane lipoprotein-sorting protein
MCLRLFACFVMLLNSTTFFELCPAQTASDKGQDAVAVLDKSAAFYRELKDFHLERVTTIQESVGEKAGKNTEIKFLTATIDAQRVKEDQVGPSLGMSYCNLTMEIGGKKFSLINNDRQGVWYSSRENEYQKGNGILVMGSVGGSMYIEFHYFPYHNLDKDVLRDPRIVREAKVEVNGESRDCFVIEGTTKNKKIEDFAADAVNAATLGKAPEFKPDKPALGMEFLLNMLQMQGFTQDADAAFFMPADESTKVTLWIDKANHALVRSETTAMFKKGSLAENDPAKQEDVRVTITDAFTVMKLNEKPAKDLFKFTPPAGAKEKKKETGSQPE